MKKWNSVHFMIVSIVSGLLAVLSMFIPLMSGEGKVYAAACNNIFFSRDTGIGTTYNGVWPVFIGYMLMAVAVIAIFVLALPKVSPSLKTEKIVLIGSAACFLVGIILSALIVPIWYGLNPGTQSVLHKTNFYLLPGAYLTMFFALVAGAASIKAVTLDW